MHQRKQQQQQQQNLLSMYGKDFSLEENEFYLLIVK